MRLYSVTNMNHYATADSTVWVKTQKEAKDLKREWLNRDPKLEIKVAQREVPTNKDDLVKWLNYHVTGRPKS